MAKTKQISVTIPEDVLRTAKEKAEQEQRSLSNYITSLIKKATE